MGVCEHWPSGKDCPRFWPRCSPCPQLSTEDNRTPIVEGMTLFNYYDGSWGVVSDIRQDGWFSLNGTSLNGVRCSTVDPKGSKP